MWCLFWLLYAVFITHNITSVIIQSIGALIGSLATIYMFHIRKGL